MWLHQRLKQFKESLNARLDALFSRHRSTQSLVLGLKEFLGVLDQVGTFDSLKAVVEELIGSIEIYEVAAKGQEEFKVLQGELEELFKTLQHCYSRDSPPTVTPSMESLCKAISQELAYLRERQGISAARRFFEAKQNADGVLACYRRVQAHLQRLSLNANLSTWNIVDEQTTDARLDRLCPSLSACYNSRQAAGLKRGACTPGTRVDVLGHTYSWVYNPEAGSVYWLNGMAGTGKTTIAYSLCTELDGANNLGASFFCSRLLPECRDVNQIVPSIAYQLARFSRPFRSALSRVLEKERDVHTQLVEMQFKKLVIQPLVKVQETLPKDLVVVIDALDECDDKKSTSEVLEALITKTPELPIKFFITSRPEPEIRDQMKTQGDRHTISRLVLHELDEGIVQGDIEAYLKAALRPMKPSDSDITALVQRAGILFIYAATVVRYIGYDNFGRNPLSRLRTILDASASSENHAYKEIDELYSVILKAAIGDPELNVQERNDMKQVLYTVLRSREPLTIRALCGLLGLADVERAHAALRPLWSVLHVVESSELVTTLHASFPDYMFDPMRSTEYYCDPATQDRLITRLCFNRIKGTKPQFNICALESSYVRDAQVANLNARVEKTISLDLHYACRYWAAHLECTEKSSDLVELLEDFLSVRLLLWMEVMNLKQCMNAGVGVIRQAEEWCIRQACSDDLKQLMRDAWRFVAVFTLSPVSRSTPHIYVSILAFWAKSSPIAKHYAKRTPMPMVPQGPAIAQEWLKLLAIWSMNGAIRQVVWSPNGTHIAVAGGGVQLLDAVTGLVKIGPLQESSSVRSIAFSPDGSRIVSGFEGGIIMVWDAQTGEKVLGPLQGHTYWVTAVAFSPDSARIVSGSWDKTILIRDAQSGQKILGPLRGHSSPVTTIAFSPDGTRIVSGSADKNVCLWDAQSGRMVLGPPGASRNRARSTAFSLHGSESVSATDERAIRMRGALSSTYSTRITSNSESKSQRTQGVGGRNAVLAPLQGHTSSVTSVAFSPDGTRIVSSSNDMTIRVWDAQSGQMVLGPLKGHTSSVKSIAFSPDGAHIVSGSADGTVCLWDAQSGGAVLGPLEGHTGPVSSVIFSPDSTRIISSSDDNTIRTWDARSGQTASDLLQEHAGSVGSVALSLDEYLIATREGGKQAVALYHGFDPRDRNSWWLAPDGWVIDRSQPRLLVWVPSDLRPMLSHPKTVSLNLNFHNVRIGESWTECYQPV